jgi:transposase-like protein
MTSGAEAKELGLVEQTLRNWVEAAQRQASSPVQFLADWINAQQDEKLVA